LELQRQLAETGHRFPIVFVTAYRAQQWPMERQDPGLSGLDLQQELSEAGIEIPISDIPMSVQAMKAGAVEFLTKPFREQELLDAIRQGESRSWTLKQTDSCRVRNDREDREVSSRSHYAEDGGAISR
jgi:FixJ family two-component response regulator